jgi:hypothetical protein
LVASNKCDIDLGAAAKAGFKGGLLGGSIAGTLGQTEIGTAAFVDPFKGAINGFGAALTSGSAGTASEAFGGFVTYLSSLPPGEAALAALKFSAGVAGATFLGLETARGVVWVYNAAVNGRTY